MADPLRVFAVYVGGDHPRASIEVHDVQFAVGRTLEDTYPVLRARWWGTPKSLHVDGYAILDVVDGHAITPVRPEDAADSALGLYFVNVGGYAADAFGEAHRFSFTVAADKRAVWKRARAAAASLSGVHQDNLDVVDQVLSIDAALAEQRYALSFSPAPDGATGPTLVSRYLKLQA
jgi:hypothetical protein